jgi:hypothetical protein
MACISSDLASKRLQLLQEVVPAISRLSVLFNGGVSAKVEETDQNRCFARRAKQCLCVSSISTSVQPISEKFFASRFGRNSFIDSPVLPRQEGRMRYRHETWGGMRWTRPCRRTNDPGADGEVVWYQCRRFEVPAGFAASR